MSARRHGKRIGYARIMQETNALSPLSTTLDDFQRTHLYEGDALARRVTSMRTREVDGFLKNAELSGFHRAVMAAPRGAIETVPLISAWAVSGGPLDAECLDELIARLVASIDSAGPLDGIFIALHGAMGARGEVDPEAKILEAIRERLGHAVPIAASFDLHGLLTARKMGLVDYVAAYHTNPHRDHAATGERAGRLLIDHLLDRARPARAWRSLPMLSGGGAGVDFLAPSARLFRLMRRMCKRPGVRDASAFLCHVWNDHPELGWSTLVHADDAREAERLADQLGDMAWSMRHVDPPRFTEPIEAIDKIRRARLRRRLGTVCVCDASDVVGAGAPGNNTHLLQALLGADDLTSYVPLRDPDAVAALWSREVGDAIDITVGGHLDPADSPPVQVTGHVLARRETPAFGRVVALDLGRVKLVLSEAPPLVMKPTFYRDLGLEPWRADVCVVKSFFPFRLFFAAENRLSLYVKTRGVTDFDRALALPRAGPVHPLAPLVDWHPEDRRRRAGTPGDPMHLPTGSTNAPRA